MPRIPTSVKYTMDNPPRPSAIRQSAALTIAVLALIGPLLGMTWASIAAPAYTHVLTNVTPALLTAGIICAGGTAVGLALLLSFFLGAVCGYLLPGPWPYIAASGGLAWATGLGLTIGRLFSTNFLEILLQRKTAWWTTYQRLVQTVGAFLPTTIALLRLAPHMPFALTNLACARLPISSVSTWIASVVGLMPRTLFAVYIGSQLQDWQTLFDRQRPPWELLLSLVLFGLLIYFSRRVARKIHPSP